MVKISLLRSYIVWCVTSILGALIIANNSGVLSNNECYVIYGVSTLFAVISYVMGRIEDIEDKKKEDDD